MLTPVHRAALLTLAALLMPVAALVLVQVARPACRLQVIPDYVTPISYQAVLRLSPACPPGTVLRVRKSSTLSTRAKGSRVQPIRPLTGAWEVGNTPALKSPVPAKELTTLTITNWRWEWYDRTAVNPLSKTTGTWVAAEVLRAAP